MRPFAQLTRNENPHHTIQPQLEIGRKDDPQEKEADAVADKVMRMPDNAMRDDEEKVATMRDDEEKVAMMHDDEEKVAMMQDEEEKVATKTQEEEKVMTSAEANAAPAAPAGVSKGIHQTKGNGRALPDHVQQEMGGKMGADFSNVNIHTGEKAAEMNKAIGARAFTYGKDIYFNSGQYNTTTSAGKHLLAHELTHTMQQSKEVRPKIQRAVKTYGGTFDTNTYQANGGPGWVGAEIDLKFTPNDLVVADMIGLVQTVTTMKNTKNGGPVTTPSYTNPTNRKTSLQKGDKGRSIDQLDYVTQDFGGNQVSTGLPQTNPLYVTTNERTLDASKKIVPGTDKVSTTLTDSPAIPDWGAFGSHKKVGGILQAPVDATLIDTPARPIEFNGQQYAQKFEVAALALNGPMAGSYLGTIEWGWTSSAAGVATITPNPIKMVSPGIPTGDFLDAARLWNKTEFKDTKKPNTKYGSVDLPIPFVTSGAKAPQDMKMTELIREIKDTYADILILTMTLSPSTDIGSKILQYRALREEILSRKVLVKVKVKETEDWTGADEVYVKAKTKNGRSYKTVTKSMNDGASRQFEIPVSALYPESEKVSIMVYDEDMGGWDADDLLVSMDWEYPFEPKTNDTTMDGADYTVEVKLDE